MSTNADADTYRRAIDNNASVTIVCGCDHEINYPSFTRFRTAITNGHVQATHERTKWALSFAREEFTTTCTKCNSEGTTVSLLRKPHDSILLEIPGNTPGHETRTPLFSPAAPLSERRSKLTDVFNENPAVELMCGCGYHREYPSFSVFQAHNTDEGIEFEANSNFMPYAIADDSFTITCPSCHGDGGASTVFEGEEAPLVSISITQAPGCPACNAYVHPDGYKEGPDAPEIGWEYYECPECRARTRPDAITDPPDQ